MQVQHCEKCGGEYTAVAKACAECGGALSAGPPPSGRLQSLSSEETDAPAEAVEIRLDSLIATLPGKQAHVLAKTLAMDGIYAAQRCGREVQHSGPELPEQAPLAQTMAVEIYVAAADAEAATAVLHELQSEGGIQDPGEHAMSEDDLEREALAAAAAIEAAPVGEGDVEESGTSAIGSTTGLVIGLVIAVVVLMMLLGR